jgi:leader peptidase (prepilin peptidase)/N-methyltransferase
MIFIYISLGSLNTFFTNTFSPNFNYLLLLFYLIVCCYTDLKKHTINLLISIIFTLLGIITGIFLFDYSFISMIISLIPGISLFVISLIFPASLGLGDGLIFTICGIYLGINFTIQLLFLSLVISCIFSILLIIKKHSLKYQFPLAPFIFVSYVFILFTGKFL